MIQPLHVIDQAEQRTLPGHLRQQAQDGQAHQEPVRCRPRIHAERRPQCGTLRCRQAPKAVQHRRAQLVQPGEGQLHLRLHAGRALHPAVRRLPGQVIQQSRLAHAGFAVNHQDPALAGPHGLEAPVEHGAFGAAAHQLRRVPPPRKTGRLRHGTNAIPVMIKSESTERNVLFGCGQRGGKFRLPLPEKLTHVGAILRGPLGLQP